MSHRSERTGSHHLFFGSTGPDNSFRLSAEESAHAVKVLRLSPGGELRATDGTGVVHCCRLDSVSRHGATCTIVESTTIPRVEPSVTLLIGLPDRDALERVIESIVPLGVARLVPVICEHCDTPWWHTKWPRTRERLQRKAIAGVKQSLYPCLPDIASPMPFADALESDSKRLVVADMDGEPLHEAVPSLIGLPALTAVVGPPGGLSAAEHAELRNLGAALVRLSPNRLRTELAATVLCGGLSSGAAGAETEGRTGPCRS